MDLKINYLEYNDTINEKNLIVCLGFFDGMHRAHTELIRKAVNIAHEKNYKTAILTFSMNVMNFIKNTGMRCLTLIDDKARIAEELGVDYIYVMKVSKELVHMSPEIFIERFLEIADTIVVGKDFHFGYKNSGDVSLLQKNANFTTIAIPEVKYKNTKISSSEIRDILKKGNIELANYLLGRKFKITGKVIGGMNIGKRIGFPTANIDYTHYLIPKTGVYYTTVNLSGVKYKGLTNIGHKPTFGQNELTVETHLIGLNHNIYGETIDLEFNKYIRAEIKFNSEKELVEQIKKDVEQVMSID